MSRNDIEMMAFAFITWMQGPWAGKYTYPYWCQDAAVNDIYGIAEAIEACWRGF